MTVSPQLHEQVLVRDGRCFLSHPESVAQFGPHTCRDRYETHVSTDLRRLTLDHVWRFHGGIRGKRAVCLDPECPNYRKDCWHVLVVMCWKANVDGPSSAVRTAEREYLDSIYGPAPAHEW